MLKHRCKEWRDIKIHPECYWLWGTCLEYINREITDQNGKITKNFWILLDETSQTFSDWNNEFCPFCKIKLEDLL